MKTWSPEFEIEFDSKFELDVAWLLDDANFEWTFEKTKFKSPKKVPGQKCLECNAPMIRMETYTPDFVAWHPSRGEVTIEVKGGNITKQSIPRVKRFHKAHGEFLDYVIVFRNNSRIKHLTGKPTVKEWGAKVGIKVLCGLDELKDYLK